MDAVLIAYLIRRAAERRGGDFYTFAERALYDKHGDRTMVIEPDQYGNPLAQGYVLASARDWARIGNLLLQNGAWNGQQLLPPEYVRFMRTPAPAWVADGRPWYGGFVWLNRADLWPAPADSYALAGAGGQSTVIVPTHDLVIVRMGHMRGEKAAEASSARAMKLILEAVPQSRAVEPAYPPRP
jgi:CubicO group peptidase (beta-lactamase class C family)